MRIGLDVSGGDFAPKSTLHGAISAQKELPSSDRIVLIGDKEIILPFLEQEKADLSLFDIVHAPDIIGMDTSGGKAIQRAR